AQLFRNGISVFTAEPSFVDPHTIRMASSRGESTVSAGSVGIATGTGPATSAKVPVNGQTVVLSDQVLQLPALPKTLIVVGGGVIGVEYACMFAALGVRVVLIEKRPRLLEFADAEIVEALGYHLGDHRGAAGRNEEVD